MKEIKHIVCALDLTDDEEIIVFTAADLARKYEANLTLLHVISPPEHLVVPALAGDTNIWLSNAVSEATSESDVKNGLAKDGQSRLQMLGVLTELNDVSQEVAFHHNASDAICNYVRSNNTDLVVVGSHGRHGFFSLFTEKNTETVVNKAPCDVYAVQLD